MTGLIDIGANLTHDSFDRDRDEVVERATAAGLTRIIVTGTSVTDSQHAAALARRYPDTLYATAGVHPHHAKTFDVNSANQLAALAAQPQVVAIGETGLDFFRNYSTPAEQIYAFEAQLGLAARLELPVFLHQRDAHDRFMEILQPARAELLGGVAHCFTGDADELAEYLALDLYIGITGWICDERRGQHLKGLVSHIPLERLLLETDAPYLLPRDLAVKPRGRRNEPALLAHILDVVAKCLDLTPGELAHATSANAERLFRLSPQPERAR